ncbi:MAG: GDP-L-fucose synthase, partial [Myxococcales bacterium]|nr:GDP-L-fucose synthase [Myxococcales bacterium]
IQTNVIDAAFHCGVQKLLFLGSSCVYPKLASQPIEPDALLTGPLEPTNEWYAVAKIAGINLAQALKRQHGFRAISCMPTNLYGPRDNFDLASSHVLPALMRKFHEAKVSGSESVTVWGSGSPLREFMHVLDFADACLFLMHHYEGEELINVGTGEEVTIRDLALLLKRVIGYAGELEFDRSKPDGTPRKVMNSEQIRALGWKPKYDLEKGVVETYKWYLENQA